MLYRRTTTPADVVDTLKKYQIDLKSTQIWMSVWPLIDRLIEREHEMLPVWQNIASQSLTRQQCYGLLEQIVLAGKFGKPEVTSSLKIDYRQLEALNTEIRNTASTLVGMMTARESILNRNAFTLERTTHIVDLMEKAEGNDGRYRSFIHESLENLTCRYEGKYWPDLKAILQVIVREEPQIYIMCETDRAIINGRGKILPDYLRELFNGIENARECHWGLPDGFTLSDNSLATLATVTLDQPDVISAETVKVRRNDFSKKGVRGAWPFRSQGIAMY